MLLALPLVDPWSLEGIADNLVEQAHDVLWEYPDCTTIFELLGASLARSEEPIEVA